jgi:hypothetical protein
MVEYSLKLAVTQPADQRKDQDIDDQRDHEIALQSRSEQQAQALNKITGTKEGIAIHKFSEYLRVIEAGILHRFGIQVPPASGKTKGKGLQADLGDLKGT